MGISWYAPEITIMPIDNPNGPYRIFGQMGLEYSTVIVDEEAASFENVVDVIDHLVESYQREFAGFDDGKTGEIHLCPDRDSASDCYGTVNIMGKNGWTMFKEMYRRQKKRGDLDKWLKDIFTDTGKAIDISDNRAER